MADVERRNLLEVGDLGDELGARIDPRVGREDAARVGQEQQARGAEQDCDLGGEEVVVPERDLVGGRRVVLVDDRNDLPVEQLAQRLAGVQVVGPGAHVEERQEHLGARDAARGQQIVVDPVELALPDGARRLQLVDGPRARDLHDAHPPGDRPARDDDRVVAALMQLGDLVADPGQHVVTHLARVVGDDARPELDHDRAHLERDFRVSTELVAGPDEGLAVRLGRPERRPRGARPARLAAQASRARRPAAPRSASWRTAALRPDR